MPKLCNRAEAWQWHAGPVLANPQRFAEDVFAHYKVVLDGYTSVEAVQTVEWRLQRARLLLYTLESLHVGRVLLFPQTFLQTAPIDSLYRLPASQPGLPAELLGLLCAKLIDALW